MKKKKLAIFLSHPIQYFSPLFKYISENSKIIDLTVYYFSDISIRGFADNDFNQKITWDIDLLDGYNYKFLKNIHNENTPNNFFSLINFEVFSEIKHNNYDLVLNFGWSTVSNLFVVFSSILYDVPFAIRGESPNMYEVGRKGLKQKIRKLLLSFIFKKASALFYIGTQNKLFYENSFNVDSNKLFFTPYSVNNDYFVEYELTLNKEKEREHLGIPKNQKVLIFSGKLIKRKEPMLILEALREINREDYCLLFLGSGPLEDELKEYSKINDLNVKFLGFINQTDIPKYYLFSDIFILPSTHETWGLVVNEAMCCKNAIISSSLVGSSYDIVKDDYNGYVFKSGDVNSLKEKIELLLYDNDMLENFKLNSFNIMQSWNYKKIQEGLERYFVNGKS
ncbi:glycosyltransferase family 4 protein [Sulfurimonas sp.]|uniref:glycosyltransferase family 4 protein n=1 Tax=Sulfurimonas sp. TaxID=2022749 RepID=UPI0035690013